MTTIRGQHIGTVTDADDPERRGRVKVSCASLMGMDEDGLAREYPNWIEPVFGWRTSAFDAEVGDGAACGFFFVPGVGANVILDITEGSSFDEAPGQASIGSPDPRYLGCLLSPGDDIGDEFKENYPARFGWKAPNGAMLYFDPTKGSEQIMIQSHEINGGRSFFSIDDKGSVMLATANGVLITLNAETKNIVMVDGHGNRIETAGDGLNFSSNKGPVITTSGINISVSCKGKTLIDANQVELSALSVLLGANAVEAVIKGNTFQALFNAHVHTGNAALPTSPPIVPLTGAELSLVTRTI